jgi:hypothetical protein
MGGNPLAEVQVTVHRHDGSAWQPIGFADTAGDGTFALLQPQAAGPLTLAPGAYRCTLESVGSPIQIPRVCTSFETTPLRITWSAGDNRLDLELPN